MKCAWTPGERNPVSIRLRTRATNDCESTRPLPGAVALAPLRGLCVFCEIFAFFARKAPPRNEFLAKSAKDCQRSRVNLNSTVRSAGSASPVGSAMLFLHQRWAASRSSSTTGCELQPKNRAVGMNVIV